MAARFSSGRRRSLCRISCAPRTMCAIRCCARSRPWCSSVWRSATCLRCISEWAQSVSGSRWSATGCAARSAFLPASSAESGSNTLPACALSRITGCNLSPRVSANDTPILRPWHRRRGCPYSRGWRDCALGGHKRGALPRREWIRVAAATPRRLKQPTGLFPRAGFRIHHLQNKKTAS